MKVEIVDSGPCDAELSTLRRTRDRDQLWAEAYKRYQDGGPWWLDTQELNDAARKEQDQRYDVGVWDEVILAWLDDPKQRSEVDGACLPIEPFDSTRDAVTVTDLLLHAIGKPVDRCTQADRNQVARCLIHDGWTRKRYGAGDRRGKWFYQRPT